MEAKRELGGVREASSKTRKRLLEMVSSLKVKGDIQGLPDLLGRAGRSQWEEKWSKSSTHRRYK
jgi:hypothetical protein